MLKYVVMIIVLLSAPVMAEIVISQVLYDPIGTESGGEAIELKNTGNEPIDISGWMIATEASGSDVKFPSNTFILPKQTFLVADTGWADKKDIAEWKNADLEDAMTLGNSDSGVALKNQNGSFIDALGWGDDEEIEDGLWEGSPANMVSAGKSLLRVDNTNDNSDDFLESEANFFDGVPVVIAAEVTLSAPVVEVSEKLELAPESFLTIKNNRDTAIGVELILSDLFSGGAVIEKENIEIEDMSFSVGPKEEKKIKVSLKDVSAPPGKYMSMLRVKIS